ncbi:TPA: hypothetical protein NGR22_004733 [Vibrio parahaemolyticus]|nr:hypothetical protein [Vibrio parahaemolyticus]
MPEFLDVVAKETKSDKCFVVQGGNFCLNSEGDCYQHSLTEYLNQLTEDPFYKDVISKPIGSTVQLSKKTKMLIAQSKFKELYKESNTSEILATVNFQDNQFLAFSLNRAPGQKCFEESHGQYLSLLMPHLTQASSLQNVLQPKTFDNPNLQIAVELCAKPAAILNSKSSIVCMNHDFEKWALEQPLLCMSNHLVRFKLHKLDSLFSLYLHMKCFGSSRNLSIKISSSVLRFLPVPSTLAPKSALIIIDCPHPPDISWVHSHYDLTTKEYQVLKQLAQGHSLHEISDTLFISYHTQGKIMKNPYGIRGQHK